MQLFYLPINLIYLLGVYIIYTHIGLVGRLFTNGSGDWGSIPGLVIPKTQKTLLDTSLLSTQHKVGIKGNVEQFRERSSAFLYTLV